MLKKLISSFTLCALFLLANNSYAKSPEDRFFEQCKQFACKEECQSMMATYKKTESNTAKLREITKKLLDNEFRRYFHKLNWIQAFLLGVKNDDGLDSEYIKQAQDLIENQLADINDQQDVPILIIAVNREDSAFVQWLVDHGANINAVYKVSDANVSCTALTEASNVGNVKTVAILLKADADTTFKDHNGKNALDYAREKKHATIEKMLKERMEKIKNHLQA